MKRDPRLRRLGERRSERHLHGVRLTPAFQLAKRLSLALGSAAFAAAGLSRSFASMARASIEAQQAHERFAVMIKRQGEAVAADLTQQLQRDGELHGETRVVVHFDPLFGEPRIERYPPEAW